MRVSLSLLKRLCVVLFYYLLFRRVYPTPAAGCQNLNEKPDALYNVKNPKKAPLSGSFEAASCPVFHTFAENCSFFFSAESRVIALLHGMRLHI